MSDSPRARPSPQGEFSLERDPGWPCPPPKAPCLLSAPDPPRTEIRPRPTLAAAASPPQQPPPETLPRRVAEPGPPRSSHGRSQAGPAEAGSLQASGSQAPPSLGPPPRPWGSPQPTQVPAAWNPPLCPSCCCSPRDCGALGSSAGLCAACGVGGASPRVPLWRCVRPHGQSCAVTVWPKGARRSLTHGAPTPGPSPARSSKRSLLTAKWGPSLCRQQRAGAQPGVATGKHPEPCLARHTLPPRAWPAPGETHTAPPPPAGLWRAGAASDPVPPPVRTRVSGHRHHAFTSLVKNTENLESLGSWLYLF